MGKDWDHGVPGEAFWREALRVAKPGAHLVAFGGTRTYHRLTCAIEDAGWEIRDCLSWLYGSGFPKSHDVSKAMDKMDAAEEQMARRYRFTEWVRSTGVTARQINDVTHTEMGNHYTTHPTQPAIMTREHLEKCRHLLGGVDVPEWVERECDIRSVESRNFAEREVIGTEIRYNEPSGIVSAGRDERTLIERKITAPATNLARQWQGWGTALKPAWEPIILARKPLVGTVAANVAQYGTGGINVDGCRIGTSKPVATNTAFNSWRNLEGRADRQQPEQTYDPNSGRWPANVCLDEDAAGMFPESRFFYTAKASRKEREAGLEGMPEREYPVAVIQTQGVGLAGESLNGKQVARSRNFHPTVKPIALMRWLCRLVTPKGGLILDPFTGSGTTGCAAVLEGFRFVGVEREPEYAAIAEKRIAHWAAQTPDADLFTEAL
jgi:DNA modification methylase